MIEQILTFWRWQNLFAQWPTLLRAFFITLEAAVLALILALVLGGLFGLMSAAHHRLPRAIARVYVEFFQNTPLMIQLFFVFFALPYAGISLPAFACGVLCVGVYTGAYISEVVRAGISSIPQGQFEAAYSQGFTYLQTMLLIVLPQTVKMILPPLANQCVNLVKNTSVLATVAELLFRTKNLMSIFYNVVGRQITALDVFLLFGFAMLLYFIVNFTLSCVVRYLQKRSSPGFRAASIGQRTAGRKAPAAH